MAQRRDHVSDDTMRGCDEEQLHRLRRAAAIVNAAHLAVQQTRASRVIANQRLHGESRIGSTLARRSHGICNLRLHANPHRRGDENIARIAVQGWMNFRVRKFAGSEIPASGMQNWALRMSATISQFGKRHGKMSLILFVSTWIISDEYPVCREPLNKMRNSATLPLATARHGRVTRGQGARDFFIRRFFVEWRSVRKHDKKKRERGGGGEDGKSWNTGIPALANARKKRRTR